MSDDSQWMSARATQDYLQRGDRMIRKYAAAGKIRTRLRGRRVEYFKPDIEALAAEILPDQRDHVPEQSLLPAGELLNHIRDLERQLNEATAQIGYFRGLLEERSMQIEEAKSVRVLLTDKEREAAALQRALTNAQGGQRSAWILVAVLVIVVIVVVVYLLMR